MCVRGGWGDNSATSDSVESRRKTRKLLYSFFSWLLITCSGFGFQFLIYSWRNFVQNRNRKVWSTASDWIDCDSDLK